MSKQESQLWVRMASGTVKGPFAKPQVVSAWKQGRLPAGCSLSTSPEGPWKAVEKCFPASSAPSVEAKAPAVAPPGPVQPASQPEPAAPVVPAPAAPIVGAASGGLPADSLALDPSLSGIGAVPQLLKASWKCLRSNYRPILSRSFVTMAIVALLGSLPLVLAVAGMIGEMTIGRESVPGLDALLGLGVVLDIGSMFLLVPFAMMFASAGALMILSFIRSGSAGGWSALLGWTASFDTMYGIGFLASGNAVVGMILGKLLSGGERAGSQPGMLERVLTEGIESAPWALLLLAGMAVLESKSMGVKAALQWALRACTADRAVGLVAIVAASLIAAVCTACLVLPAVFIGYPLLFVVIATVYMRARAVEGAPQSAVEGSS
jgi:hypothetical protein